MMKQRQTAPAGRQPGPPATAGHPGWGVAAAVAAFLIWGLSPVYWKLLQDVPALETIMHRMVWSFFLLLPLLILQGRWHSFRKALRNPRTMGILLATAGLVSLNWFVYIWAVNHDFVLQASLGYYINPLVNVLLGMVFLKERLGPTKQFAVALAAAGVLYLTLQYGEFPWIALVLAFSFGFYGLIRKVAPVGSLEGLAAETLVLSLPAVIFLCWLNRHGAGAFLRIDRHTDLLLMGAALVTAVPLLLFNIGTRRLNLSTVGFLQYLAPSCMFLLAVFVFDEPLHPAQMKTFLLVWTSLGIYTLDSWRGHQTSSAQR